MLFSILLACFHIYRRICCFPGPVVLPFPETLSVSGCLPHHCAHRQNLPDGRFSDPAKRSCLLRQPRRSSPLSLLTIRPTFTLAGSFHRSLLRPAPLPKVSADPSGVCLRQSRMPLDHSGVCWHHSRLPLDHSGVCLRHSRLPFGHSGVCLRYSRLPFGPSGVRLRHSRLPLDHSGVRRRQFRLPLGHSGVRRSHSR